MKNDNMKLGRRGEDIAAGFLVKNGCAVLERNYRCRYGEIDIIALDHGVLCFVEVKTRSRKDYGLPCQAVDWKKEQHIKRCAYVYLQNRKKKYEDIRIDIVEVIRTCGKYAVRWIKGGRAA